MMSCMCMQNGSDKKNLYLMLRSCGHRFQGTDIASTCRATAGCKARAACKAVSVDPCGTLLSRSRVPSFLCLIFRTRASPRRQFNVRVARAHPEPPNLDIHPCQSVPCMVPQKNATLPRLKLTIGSTNSRSTCFSVDWGVQGQVVAWSAVRP
jgi:hypothetical protein